MAKKSSINMSLPAADDLFSTQEQREEESREKVMDIPLEEISDFPDHPFKVRADENMMDMAESIKQYGVLVPAIVREKEGGGYEMVAGHRRKMASELAEKKEMPCIVRKLSDDEAILIMVDSNLQREQILPSEKAFAYKMKLEAMKRQAGRPSKNSATVLQNFEGKSSRQILAEQSGESHEQIRKFIRLTELLPPILDMVDENRIALRPAVELSYLPKEEQSTLFDTMQSEDCTPSHAQAIKLRKFSEEGKLNPEVMLSILAEEKPNQIEKFKMPMNKIEKYFPKGASNQQMEDIIIKALELYRKRERNREKER